MTLPVASLAALLLAAVFFDLRSFRIPNAIVFGGTALALLLHALLPAGIGTLDSLAGLAVGLAGFLPLYLLRAIGAGDVKLMAMAGAFLGPRGAFAAIVLGFAAGALLALLFALKGGVLRKTVLNLRLMAYSALSAQAGTAGPQFDPRADTAARIPYSLAIALGCAGWLALRQDWQ